MESKNSLLMRAATCGVLSCLLAACATTQQESPRAASATSANSVSAVSAYSNEEAADPANEDEPRVERPTSAMNWMPGKAERKENRKSEARDTRRNPDRGKTIAEL